MGTRKAPQNENSFLMKTGAFRKGSVFIAREGAVSINNYHELQLQAIKLHCIEGVPLNA